MRQVIRAELRLEAVGSLGVGSCHYTCVVDQDVELVALAEESFSGATNAAEGVVVHL